MRRLPNWLLATTLTLLVAVGLSAQAANSLVKTEQFSDTGTWVADAGGYAVRSTVTANSDAAPTFAGGSAGLADNVADNSAATFSDLTQVITVPNDSTDWTYSVFIKKDAVAGSTRMPSVMGQLTGGSTLYFGVYFDTSTGTYTTNGAYDNAGIDSFDATWWRVHVRKANNSSGNTTLRCWLFPALSKNGTSDDATTTGSVVAWGANATNTTALQTYAPDPYYLFGAASGFLTLGVGR